LNVVCKRGGRNGQELPSKIGHLKEFIEESTMLSAPLTRPLPQWFWSQRNVARESAMEKITCPLCGSDRLIKLQMKRVSRTGKVLTVYCCPSDAHMFLPEIELKDLIAESRGTKARRSKNGR
jgi:DNA-directed RNA polymerase subunit RPC12/RpoP